MEFVDHLSRLKPGRPRHDLIEPATAGHSVLPGLYVFIANSEMIAAVRCRIASFPATLSSVRRNERLRMTGPMGPDQVMMFFLNQQADKFQNACQWHEQPLRTARTMREVKQLGDVRVRGTTRHTRRTPGGKPACMCVRNQEGSTAACAARLARRPDKFIGIQGETRPAHFSGLGPPE